MTTANGWQPRAHSVSRSACRPAPLVGSVAANVSTIGGTWTEGMGGGAVPGGYAPSRALRCCAAARVGADGCVVLEDIEWSAAFSGGGPTGNITGTTAGNGVRCEPAF